MDDLESSIGWSAPNVSRRRLLSAVCIVALAGPPFSSLSAQAEAPDPLQSWLKAHAVPVRSVDAGDDDYSDLEPLGRLIGEARVVQLGEPSHGAGTCFAAKARIVKFLHERKGFDVLAWESGFFDVTRTEAGLSSGEDAVASAQRGILKIWSASEECRALFEYAKASHASRRPLVMAGFDMQFTSPGAFEAFGADLRAGVSAISDPGTRIEAMQAAEDALQGFKTVNSYIESRTAAGTALVRGGSTGPALSEAMAAWERETGAALRPRGDMLQRLQRSVEKLAVLFDSNKAAFGEGGERQRSFLARAVENLGGYGANMFELYAADLPARPNAEVERENRRDAINFRNLRWLLERGYPQRKVIVWAHDTHVMNAFYAADFKSVSLDPIPLAMKPTGVFMREWLGDNVYTIGFTTYEGADATILNPVKVVPAAPAGSLEERMHRLGFAFAALDLRNARRAVIHPLRAPQIVRLPKYEEIEIADATRAYDAVFYIDQMKPATLIR